MSDAGTMLTIEERAPFHLMVEGIEAQISTLEELHAHLATFAPDPYGELWITDCMDRTLGVFINGDRAWLMYLRYSGDAGLSSRNPDYHGSREVLLPFELINGQRDEFPVYWTVATDEALRVFEHFLVQGMPSPAITWHDDAGDDPE